MGEETIRSKSAESVMFYCTLLTRLSHNFKMAKS